MPPKKQLKRRGNDNSRNTTTKKARKDDRVYKFQESAMLEVNLTNISNKK